MSLGEERRVLRAARTYRAHRTYQKENEEELMRILRFIKTWEHNIRPGNMGTGRTPGGMETESMARARERESIQTTTTLT